MRLGTLTVAAGFCIPATDGAIGVKLDGITPYAAWRLEYAPVDQGEVKRDLLEKHMGNTLLADQGFAQLKKDAARYQDIGVRRGQDSLCKSSAE